MAWEWVAPTAAAVTGALGIGFTFYAGKQGRDQTAALTRNAQAHDLHMARLARRTDAYVESLDVTEQLGNWAQSVHPILDTSPPQPLPKTPDAAVQARAVALIGALGSKEAQVLMEAWRDAFHAVTVRADILTLEKQQPTYTGSSVEGSPWGELRAAKAVEASAREALTARLNQELTRDHPEPPPPA